MSLYYPAIKLKDYRVDDQGLNVDAIPNDSGRFTPAQTTGFHVFDDACNGNNVFSS